MTAYVNTLTTIPYYYLHYRRKNLCGNIQHFLYYYILGFNFLIIIVIIIVFKRGSSNHFKALRLRHWDSEILMSNTHTYTHTQTSKFVTMRHYSRSHSILLFFLLTSFSFFTPVFPRSFFSYLIHFSPSSANKLAKIWTEAI